MAARQYMTWPELDKAMTDFNTSHGYTTKGTDERLVGVVVFTEDSFKKPYTEIERSYRFTSDNKAFLPSNIGYSIFAECLDGTEPCVRIEEWIRGGKMKIEQCYIEE